ncbi:MAG: hypothetical protein AB1646_26705 [Thermodesulfobacteriota bacterium]
MLDEINESGIEMGPLRPEDARGITTLFREVYGEGYPIRLFYDPVAITEANDRGDYLSFVARTASSRVVAVMNLFRSAPYHALYELGAGLVLSDYRRLGLSSRLFHFVFEEWAANRPDVEEIFGEPVCNHLHMQRLVERHSHVEMALEIALMPAEAYDKEKSAGGRVATLLTFRCYRPNPHGVFVPAAYEDELRWLYEALDDSRELSVSTERLPPQTPTRAEMTVFDFGGVARIALHETGADLPLGLKEMEEQALARNVVVFQVWLRLTEPWVGNAVEVLRSQGYFIGGLLPRWFDDDGMLMQKLIVPPDFEEIELYSDRAKEILRIVMRDWSRAH